MKKNIFICLLLASTVFVGCSKDDGPVPEEVKLERVPVPLVVKNGGSQSIDMVNLGSFKGIFNVGLYFPNDVKPEKYDVVIRKNGNNGNVKLIQAGVSTYPTTLEITAAQIATLFGTAVVLNDSYDIGVDVYANGKKYEAFPVTGAGYAAGVAGQPGASVITNYSAICAYDPALYSGAFLAADQFGDADGATITLTTVSPTSFSFTYPSALNPKPIVVNVNTGTNVATIPGTPLNIGTQWSPNPPYNYPNNATYANPSLNSMSNGLVKPCDKTVTFTIQWGTNNGALQFGGGPYVLTLTKI